MGRSRWLVAALAALLAAASDLRAGAPFGGDDPGCVPDGKAAATCGDVAGKALGKLFRSVTACHTKLADSAFKHVAFDEDACERTDPAKSAKAKFDASVAKLGVSCSGTSIVDAADALASTLLAGGPTSGFRTLTGAVYCDATTAKPLDPGGDDAGFVPADKKALACGDAVAKGLAKMGGAVFTCHRKAAASGLAGGSTDDEACESRARTKFDGQIAKIAGKGGCPACLDAQAGSMLADAVVAFAEQAGGSLYPCAATTTTTTTSSTTTTTMMTGCTPAATNRPFTVSFDVPDSSVLVQGLTLLIDYPEAQVTIPGSGGATSVRQAIIDIQPGAISQPFDLDDSLREQIAGTANPLTPGALFTINFLDCQGATPPTEADFTCTVEVATDPLGLSDEGVTCSVSAG